MPKDLIARYGVAADRLAQMVIREIRKTHEHLLIGTLINVGQTILLVGVFYLMSTVSGFGTTMIRGDLLIYLITGVFLFNVHVRSVMAVLSAEGASSPLMSHAPMTRSLAITAAAIAALYSQITSVLIVFALYHALVEPVEFHEPLGFAACMILAWASGSGVGLMLGSLRTALGARSANFLSQVYSRVNMVASGQMFVANMLPAKILVWLGWNPVFHMIDQARGYAFLNYTPRFTNLEYPLIATAALLIVGLLSNNYADRRAKLSAG